MKVICIVQARTGSTRLPAKVLKKICNKTILEHVIDRLKRIDNIDEIVIATTTLEQDNAIVAEAARLKVPAFRGSENDVLSRYYNCSKQFNADIVVRITSDCPLIDKKITKQIIKYYLDNYPKFDYVSNTIERTFPRGLDTEVFSFKALEKAFYEAESQSEREHVTPYIWCNPDIFKMGQYIGFEDFSNLRWTLDTKEDFVLINEIYKYLYEEFGNDFDSSDILKLYNKYEELLSINDEIEQKKI